MDVNEQQCPSDVRKQCCNNYTFCFKPTKSLDSRGGIGLKKQPWHMALKSRKNRLEDALGIFIKLAKLNKSSTLQNS